MRLKSNNPIPPLELRQTKHDVGHAENFSVVDFAFRKTSTIDAELRVVSPHAYFYVERGLNVSQRALESSAAELEERIVPAVFNYVNPSWAPGAGLDTRLTIVHARVVGVAGYVTALDLLPKAVYPYSNERSTVYMSIFSATPGTERYYAVLAHEVQHLAQMQANPNQETWVQEGSSELFSELAGYSVNLQGGFLANPDIHLVNWDSQPEHTARHYGAAYMFMRYLGAQVGYERLPILFALPQTGMAGVDALSDRLNDPRSAAEMLRDWTVTNAFEASHDPRFKYEAPLPGRVLLPAQAIADAPQANTMAQYSGSYTSIASANAARTLLFDGVTVVPLVETTAPSGARFWWSNRGDHIASTLTRSFDLTKVDTATMKFRLWYDIEEQFDFGYAAASRDGGQTWETLGGRHTTEDNSLGQSFGHGYTGRSGKSGVWVDEVIDLTAYARGSVLLRFIYVTDEGISHPGLAIDDISIPEIGFHDGAEKDGGWIAEGFSRSDNRVPQRFFLTLVFTDNGEVRDVPLDAGNNGAVSLPPGRPAVLVVTAMAPLTSIRAGYTYELRSGQ